MYDVLTIDSDSIKDIDNILNMLDTISNNQAFEY